ncbi:MAG: hypothetical protein IIW89_07820, partial [Alistipes sp.]|nr:hypothetical protein [Alistipes sp.]
MATVEEITLKVNALEAAHSVKDLRGSMGALRKIVNETKIGSDEYKAALDGVQKAQNMLANATKLGVTETAKAEKSYNALSREMAELKQQFKSAKTEADRMNLAPKIKEINDQLKDMDASVGVFTRNVGDYANQMAGAFQQTAGAAGAVVAPLQRVVGIFNVLKAHPIIAILGLITSLIYGVANASKAGEEGAQRWNVALAAFKPIGDFFTKLLHQMQKELTWVIEKIGQFAQWIGILGDKSKEYQRIAEEEIEIQKAGRKLREEEAKMLKEIARLRADANDKLNNNGRESQRMLRKAMEMEQELANKREAFSKREEELITAKNALMPSSTEELNEETDAWVKVEEQQTKVLQKQREYNAQLYEAGNRAKAEEEATRKALEEREKLEEFKSRQLAKQMEGVERSEEDEWLMAIEEGYYKEQALMDAHLEEMKKKQDQALQDQLDRDLKERKSKEDLEKAKQALQKNGLAVAANIADSVAGIVGKETALGKAMAVASTTISTYQSATEAYKSMAGIPIVGPALGAAAAAAAVVSGIANVKSILAVKTDGSTTSMPNISGASVQTYAPAVVQNVPVTRTLTGASEEAKLNQILDNTSA